MRRRSRRPRSPSGSGRRRSTPRRRCRRRPRRPSPIVDSVMPPSTCSQTASCSRSTTSRAARSLGSIGGHEALPAESRFDGHHEQLVELRQQLEVRVDAGARLHREPGAGADRPEAARERDRILGRLGVEGHREGAELGVAGSPAIDVGDHEVHVERNRRDRLQPLHHLRTEGQVRHEVVVHDVDVHRVGGGDPRHLGLEVREVGGEDARVDAAREPRVTRPP